MLGFALIFCAAVALFFAPFWVPAFTSWRKDREEPDSRTTDDWTGTGPRRGRP